MPDQSGRYHEVDNIPFVKEDIQNGTCFRAIRLERKHYKLVYFTV